MASTAAFSTFLSLPRSRTRPVLSPSSCQCQLRRPTGGVSFPFRLRTFKGPGIPRPPPLPLQVLCIRQSGGGKKIVLKEDCFVKLAAINSRILQPSIVVSFKVNMKLGKSSMWRNFLRYLCDLFLLCYQNTLSDTKQSRPSLREKGVRFSEGTLPKGRT